MKKVIILTFLLFPVFPVYAQIQSNPSVSLEAIEIPFEKFNVVSNDLTVNEFEKEHAINWQLSIENNIMYANPLGNAVVRLYDGINKEKFVDIGMGGPPDRKFWVAVQNPEIGYSVIHDRIEDGWNPSDTIIIAYSNTAGLTINNGQRIVVSNLDIEDFVIKDFSVFGMESSTDPPATSAGNLVLSIVSGNPSANPLFYLPFVLAGGAGILVVILLKTKKRT